MVERRADEAIQQTGKAMKRRGLMAGAAAMVAGMVAKQASQPVTAGTDGDVVLGSVGNTTTTETGVLNSGPASPGGPAIHGFRSPGAVTVVSTTLNAGVVGQTFVTDAPGVMGSSPNGSQAKGVHGISGAGYGVFGEGSTGVHGESASGIGVQGLIPDTSGSANTYAVQGFNKSSGPGGYGVIGLSYRSHGVYGEAGSDQGSGALVGVTRVSTGVAFQAVAVAPATNAGYFQGNVSVFGSLGVTGGKFAVVKSADGKYRAMHAVEAPEAWFEDVGEAQLAGGKAEINLDPLFAQHVHTDAYLVFLTANDAGCKGLAVASRRAGGFGVQELNGGTSSGTFSWKVQAKRKDIAGERLPVWEMPPTSDLPDPPKPSPPSLQPAPPPRPASSSASTPQGSAVQSPTVQPAPPSRP